jgi:hypothetical protein
MLELREGLKEFFPGLINQLNTSLDAKIEKLNKELVECNKKYYNMRVEFEAIKKCE